MIAHKGEVKPARRANTLDVTRAPIRLLVVSTQEIIAAGVATVLAGSPAPIEVQRLAGPLAEVGEVDVVLYDVLALAHGDTSELERLVALSKGVIALGRDLRPDLAARALEHGAVAVASLGGDVDDLVLAVESVYEGMSAGLEAPAQEWLAQAEGLSVREASILELVAQGLTNAEIAERLYLSINTVKTYIRTAYRKMGVDRRSQAVGWAMDRGFVSGAEERRERELELD
jgi:DNA-binding NarL/FixJ family response regulator